MVAPGLPANVGSMAEEAGGVGRGEPTASRRGDGAHGVTDDVDRGGAEMVAVACSRAWSERDQRRKKTKGQQLYAGPPGTKGGPITSCFWRAAKMQPTFSPGLVGCSFTSRVFAPPFFVESFFVFLL
jgi:hypothetical protein